MYVVCATVSPKIVFAFERRKSVLHPADHSYIPHGSFAKVILCFSLRIQKVCDIALVNN